MREGAIPREKRRDYPSLALWKTGFTTGQFLPAVADAVRSGETAKIRLGQVCVSKSCGDGKMTSRKGDIKPSPPPAGTAVGHSGFQKRAWGIERVEGCAM